MAECGVKKSDGTRCRAKALQGKARCWFHDKATAASRREAQVKGGEAHRAATLPADAPDLPLKSVEDVTAALAETINAVRKGKVAVNVGNCIGVLAGVLLKAMEGSDLERRLAALENPNGQMRRVG